MNHAKSVHIWNIVIDVNAKCVRQLKAYGTRDHTIPGNQTKSGFQKQSYLLCQNMLVAIYFDHFLGDQVFRHLLLVYKIVAHQQNMDEHRQIGYT